MKFSIKDFLSKCDQICSFLLIWSHLLKKSLMENFIFLCSVWCIIIFRILFKCVIFSLRHLIAEDHSKYCNECNNKFNNRSYLRLKQTTRHQIKSVITCGYVAQNLFHFLDKNSVCVSLLPIMLFFSYPLDTWRKLNVLSTSSMRSASSITVPPVITKNQKCQIFSEPSLQSIFKVRLLTGNSLPVKTLDY